MMRQIYVQGSLERLALCLFSLARFIEQPRLIPLRLRRMNIDAYLRFSQPWLRKLNIVTVIDIGANIGNFAMIAHATMPSAQIYAFEPLPDCYNQLLARMRGVRRFQALNIALGDKKGSSIFTRSASSEASSFLKMADVHKQLFPNSYETIPVEVKIDCLDTIASELHFVEPLLVKIDVQGYEDRVLRGGEQTIRHTKVLLIETSFEVLYEDQFLFDYFYRQLTQWGFTYCGALDQLVSPDDGRILQENSLFIQKG